MLQSEILRKAARLMEAGFCLQYENNGCGCFCERFLRARGDTNFNESLGAWKLVTEILGGSDVGGNNLYRNGWRDGDTDDAVAVLDMAADIRECEGL